MYQTDLTSQVWFILFCPRLYMKALDETETCEANKIYRGYCYSQWNVRAEQVCAKKGKAYIKEDFSVLH